MLTYSIIIAQVTTVYYNTKRANVNSRKSLETFNPRNLNAV